MKTSTTMKIWLASTLVLLFAIGSYRFLLFNASTHPKTKSMNWKKNKNASRNYSQFSPVLKNGSWILPKTIFSDHVLTLVDFYKLHMQECQNNPRLRELTRKKSSQIQIIVSSSTNSTPVFKHNENGSKNMNLKLGKMMNTYVHGRDLPTGSITFAVSGKDFDQATELCYFANSSPRGAHGK